MSTSLFIHAFVLILAIASRQRCIDPGGCSATIDSVLHMLILDYSKAPIEGGLSRDTASKSLVRPSKGIPALIAGLPFCKW